MWNISNTDYVIELHDRDGSKKKLTSYLWNWNKARKGLPLFTKPLKRQVKSESEASR